MYQKNSSDSNIFPVKQSIFLVGTCFILFIFMISFLNYILAETDFLKVDNLSGALREFVLTLDQQIYIMMIALTSWFLVFAVMTYTIYKKFKQHIDENKVLQDQLVENKIQGLRNSNMASLSTMAGGVAHEINNPLTIINGCAERLRRLHSRNQLDTDQLNSNVGKILRTTERISSISKSLKTFSRDGSDDEFSSVLLNEVITTTMNFIGEKFKHEGIEFNLNNSTNIIHLWARKTELCQALLHIINNAYEEIQTQEKKILSISIVEMAGTCIIKVTDNGKGLKPEIVNNIFEPFFTTKKVHVASGLGLTIAKGIIDGHKGKLFIEQGEQSTSFCMKLPKYQKNRDQYSKAA